MTCHRLKTLPAFWHAVDSDEKTFEVRENDRGFQKGDTLHLVLHDPRKSKYRPDREPESIIQVEVTYVLSGWGIQEGYVVLGISKP